MKNSRHHVRKTQKEIANNFLNKNDVALSHDTTRMLQTKSTLLACHGLSISLFLARQRPGHQQRLQIHRPPQMPNSTLYKSKTARSRHTHIHTYCKQITKRGNKGITITPSLTPPSHSKRGPGWGRTSRRRSVKKRLRRWLQNVGTGNHVLV